MANGYKFAKLKRDYYQNFSNLQKFYSSNLPDNILHALSK